MKLNICRRRSCIPGFLLTHRKLNTEFVCKITYVRTITRKHTHTQTHTHTHTYKPKAYLKLQFGTTTHTHTQIHTHTMKNKNICL